MPRNWSYEAIPQPPFLGSSTSLRLDGSALPRSVLQISLVTGSHAILCVELSTGFGHAWYCKNTNVEDGPDADTVAVSSPG